MFLKISLSLCNANEKRHAICLLYITNALTWIEDQHTSSIKFVISEKDVIFVVEVTTRCTDQTNVNTNAWIWNNAAVTDKTRSKDSSALCCKIFDLEPSVHHW